MRRRRRRSLIGFIFTIALLAVAVVGLGILSSGFKNWDIGSWFVKEAQVQKSDVVYMSNEGITTRASLGNFDYSDDGMIDWNDKRGTASISGMEFTFYRHKADTSSNPIIHATSILPSFAYGFTAISQIDNRYPIGDIDFSYSYDSSIRIVGFSIRYNDLVSVNSDIFEVVYEQPPAPTVPLPENPVKDGYTFIGWFFDVDCLRPYDGRPIFADTTLYAGWKINKHTIKFVTDCDEVIADVVVDYNTDYNTLPTVHKNGYTFLGWYTSDGALFTGGAVKSDMTLTAKWEEKVYKITFIVDNNVYLTIDVKYGDVLPTVIQKNNLSKFNVKSINGSFIDDIENATISGDLIIDLVKKNAIENLVENWASYAIGLGVLVAFILFLVMIVPKNKKRVV